MKELVLKHGKLVLVEGDITKQKVDAIVNAANSWLMGGGGVDGAIHRAGGPAILEECKIIVKRIGRLPSGKAVITTAGNLPARHVIHTVGPIWSGGGRKEAETLASCYRESLKLARKHGLKTVAFPAISTGAYGYPMEEAARVALKTIIDFLDNEAGLDEVALVLRGKQALDEYFWVLEKMTISP
jgi:O-acetyl-ADP-ribose deacetylase (regulator of RNase III)